MHSALPFADNSLISRREFLVYCAVMGGVLSNASAALPKNTSGDLTLITGDASSWLLPIRGKQIVFPKETFRTSGRTSGLPGSLMKLLATAILLENHLIHPNTPIDCHGVTNRKFTMGQPMHCSHAHGKVSLTEALALSCNAYFAQAIQAVSVSQFLSAYQRHFPMTRPGIRFTKDMLPACLLGCHPHMPLSGADILAWMQRLAINRDKDNKPLLSPAAFDVLRQGMRMAARQGTGRQADPTDRYRLALKTGTTKNGQVYQSWVAGYFPFDDPQFVFCTRVRNGTSEEKAIPILKALLARYQSRALS